MSALFEKSSVNFNPQQIQTLKSILVDYQHAFAKHDHDIGCFKEIVHKSDVNDTNLIKLQMRRVPLGFENEEEQCIQNMLDSSVIQESSSDWASPPVFIRNKDVKS